MKKKAVSRQELKCKNCLSYPCFRFYILSDKKDQTAQIWCDYFKSKKEL